MTNVILFDDEIRESLLPLTYTKPVGAIRTGILSIQEKWEKALGAKVSFITQDYLSSRYSIEIAEKNIVINGSVLPSFHLSRLISQLEENEALLDDGDLIAAYLDREQFDNLIQNEDINELAGFEVGDTPFIKINSLSDIFSLNGEAIKADFELLTKNRISQEIPAHVQCISPENVFIEEGAEISPCIINAETGPVYIGKDAKILEGCLIRGPFALLDNAVLKMGAKIYGATTIGPWCKVGGEISNVVFQSFSNKGHDGYLGNSVIGEWCNLGADTNNSNLKNNYSEVKLWNYPAEGFKSTGLQFCGLVMGDHSKCGINTMFNTGTVIGVFANIFGAGYPRNFVPSFSWGGPGQGYKTYKIEKAFDTAEKVMIRRNIVLDDEEREILKHVFESSAKFRNWEKNPTPARP